MTTAADVKALRERSGVGMMECKKALDEAGGDMERAGEILRERGLQKAASRIGRENTEGAVAICVVGDKAAMVLAKCETDFTAKSEPFVDLTRRMAEWTVESGVSPLITCGSSIDDMRLTTKENIELGDVIIFQGEPGVTLDSYLHTQDGRGIGGVLVAGRNIDEETLHQIALHIAFAKPDYISEDHISETTMSLQRDEFITITEAEGKPAKILDRIVDGRMASWVKDQTLLSQSLHGDGEIIGELIGPDGEIVFMSQVGVR